MAEATIGHNNPPAPTPFEAHQINAADLTDEAKNFLDGKPIETEGQAEAVAKILTSAREAWKAADEQRKVEKRPHDAAAQAVQDQWNPLLGTVKKVEDAAKAAQTAWLIKKDEEQREIAAKAKAEADRLAEIAAEAARSTPRDDLAAMMALETAIKVAGVAGKVAARADKAKPRVSGGGRAIGLRGRWIAELVDPVAALKHYREHQPEALKAWLVDQAQRDANAGARAIPGFAVNEDRRAA
jgi:hypothetical protein